MKRWRFLIILCLLGSGSVAVAQSYELQRLILDIQKLEEIKKTLSGLYKSYEILEKGYTAIREISKGSFQLHNAFLGSLREASPPVKKYYKVSQIIARQLEVVHLSRSALHRYEGSDLLSGAEQDFLTNVYGKIINRSFENLGSLLDVLGAGTLRMSDAERLSAIDRIDRDTGQQLSDARWFTRQSLGLTSARQAEAGDLESVRGLFDRGN